MIKRLLPFLFLALILDNSSFSQSWEEYTVPRSRHVNAIHCLDYNRLIALGGWESNDSIQSIFTSVDGCYNWGTTYDNIDPWITDMAYEDGQLLAVGFGGLITRSMDYGFTWSDDIQVPEGVSQMHFQSIDMMGNHAFVVGGNLGDMKKQSVLKSIDGGNSWVIIKKSDDKPYLNDVHMISASKFISVGEEGVILSSEDGGVNFSEQIYPGQYSFFDVEFIDENTGFIVGGIASSDSVSLLIRTVDGGSTWTEVINETGSCLRDLYFLDEMHAYLVGDDMVFYISADGGNTWQKEAVPNESYIYDFRSVYFLDQNFGYIAGTNGKVLKYNPDQLIVNEMLKNKSKVIVNNPVDDELVICLEQEVFTLSDNILLEILDLGAGPLKQVPLESQTNEVYTGDLSSGVYPYIVKSKSQIIHSGMIIKK